MFGGIGLTRERGLRLYIGILGCLTATVLALAVVLVARMPVATLVQWAPTAAAFVALGWLGSRQLVYLSETNSAALGTIAHMITLIILPFPVAMLTIAFAKGLSELSLKIQRRSRRWRAVVVNVSATLLAVAAAGAAFHLLQGDRYLWAGGIRVLMAFPALGALGALYHVTDVLAVVGAISLSSQDRPWSVFGRTFKDLLLPQLSLILVGIVFAVLWHVSPFLSLFVVVPVIFSARSFESVAQLRKETVEAVLKLAESIDYRDTGTHEHSQRLAKLTERLTIAAGLIPEHVAEIVLAARVHDLGKIGISNEILLKEGSLTPEEKVIMEAHPAIGATILSSFSAFAGQADIVKHHHERWAGNGYPDGLKGEEIPLGSRIIAVVDSFEAMMTDRPYRQGMSVAAAVERLKDGMGSQFDPKLCATFIQMLIEDGMYTPPQQSPDLHVLERKVG